MIHKGIKYKKVPAIEKSRCTGCHIANIDALDCIDVDCDENSIFIIDNKDKNKFTYTNIVTPGCEGTINLFFGEHCIAMVNNVELANQIREEIPEREKTE